MGKISQEETVTAGSVVCLDGRPGLRAVNRLSSATGSPRPRGAGTQNIRRVLSEERPYTIKHAGEVQQKRDAQRYQLEAIPEHLLE